MEGRRELPSRRRIRDLPAGLRSGVAPWAQSQERRLRRRNRRQLRHGLHRSDGTNARAPDMGRPPSHVFLVGLNREARGPGDCGEFAGARGACAKSIQPIPCAASSQPPHMSISQSISRTTSFPVYERRYPRTSKATTDFRRFSVQRSLTMAASTSSAISPASDAGCSTFPSSVCTRAASVMLDTSQTPCAANKSAGRSAR